MADWEGLSREEFEKLRYEKRGLKARSNRCVAVLEEFLKSDYDFALVDWESLGYTTTSGCIGSLKTAIKYYCLNGKVACSYRGMRCFLYKKSALM